MIRIGLDRLDLYLLRRLSGPLALVLATVLVTQLLERALRLFELAAVTGAPLSTVAMMAANLVPHYLGMALPAAFTAAMFLAVARLSDDSEVDIMLCAGRSLGRIAVPYFAFGLILAAFSFYLFGYSQPLSRYAYRAHANEALQTRWDARVEDNRFVSAGAGFTMSADTVELDQRRLHGVFLQRRTPSAEEITTARNGRLVLASDGRRLLLHLEEGILLREDNNGTVSVSAFESSVINADFTPAPQPFRARGASPRELTLPELWDGLHGGATSLSKARLAGEFHGRLARSLVPSLLPLLAIPLAMASKRRRRAAGLVVTALALLALNHSLQLGESLAESGRANALAAVWTPLVAFAVFCVWLFRSSLAWPGDNAVTRAAHAIESAFQGLRRPSGRRE